jgi:Raf kinase inhibitor-like YbhB/YbcL family protein
MKAGDQLPNIYTCKGASESPEISWDNIPQGTKSLALILDDPDAPAGTFTHWILYNIPSEVHSISAGQTFQNVLSNGAQQGENSAGTLGYFSPCPPIGPAHRYIFTLYALDNRISMPAADRNGIEEAMKGRVIGSAKFITMFAR